MPNIKSADYVEKEIREARTDIDNKAYPTLKERIDDYNTYINNEKSYNVLTSPYALTSNKNANWHCRKDFRYKRPVFEACFCYIPF